MEVNGYNSNIQAYNKIIEEFRSATQVGNQKDRGMVIYYHVIGVVNFTKIYFTYSFINSVLEEGDCIHVNR